MCSLGIEPTTFCAANAMLYHWATGTLIKQQNTEKNHSLLLTEKLKYSCFRNQSISIFILTFVHSVSWMLLLNTSIVHGNKALFVLLSYYLCPLWPKLASDHHGLLIIPIHWLASSLCLLSTSKLAFWRTMAAVASSRWMLHIGGGWGYSPPSM